MPTEIAYYILSTCDSIYTFWQNIPYQVKNSLYLSIGILILYWRTLKYGYVCDDLEPSKRRKDDNNYFTREDMQHNIQENGRIAAENNKNKDVPNYVPLIFTPISHKVKNIFHKLWLEIIGDVYFSSKRAHLITLTLHVITCNLIYYAFGANYLSLLAAWLFAINPINSQGGSIWLSGKNYNISSIMALLMWLLPAIAPIPYFIVKFFNINAIFSPLIFVQTPYYYWIFLPLFGVALHSWILKIKKDVGTNSEMSGVKPIKIIPFFKSFAYYTLLCIVPFRLALYHHFIWGIGVNKHYNKIAYKISPMFFTGLFLFSGMAYLVYYYWGFAPSIGIMWFMINIAMWCNVVTFQQQISERCVHTANIGLMYALAWFIIPFPLLVMVFITFYLTRLWYAMPMYKNEYWHTEYSAIEDKDCNYVWISRGVKKYFTQDYVGAFFDFIEAKRCSPWEFKANLNAANMAIIMQNLPQAEALLNDCEHGLYDGKAEKYMLEQVNLSRDIIRVAKETKTIDISRIMIVR